MTARFLSGVGAGAMRARSESPPRPCATPRCQTGTTRALRRRQLPTNHCHAALPWRVTRASQRDSSSKPPARPPGVDPLGNLPPQPDNGSHVHTDREMEGALIKCLRARPSISGQKSASVRAVRPQPPGG